MDLISLQMLGLKMENLHQMHEINNMLPWSY